MSRISLSNILSFLDIDLQSANISTYFKCIPQLLAYRFKFRNFALSSEGGEDFFFLPLELGLVCMIKKIKEKKKYNKLNSRSALIKRQLQKTCYK